MKLKLRPNPVKIQETTYRQITPGEIHHFSREGWKNDGIAAYEEVYGIPISQGPKDLPIPFPKNTFGERLKLHTKNNIARSMFWLLSYFTKKRGTHRDGGAGAKGTFTPLENEAAKRLAFCADGTVPIRLRHSNASFEDDACSQVRAMAFCIDAPDGKQDFILGTGYATPFWNLTSLLTFGKYRNQCKNDDWSPQKEWLKSPTAFVTAIEAIRLAPECYTKMSYYSAIAYAIPATNDYVKFRVIPKDMGVESGLLSPEQQRSIWVQNRLDGNEKPQKYLADVYRDKLNTGAIEYMLEAQFRTFDESSDTQEFFNITRYWDDEKYPWEPIGTLTAECDLTDEETDDLTFWLGNLPKGTELIDVYSGEDYNTITYVRLTTYPRAQKLRKRGEKE